MSKKTKKGSAGEPRNYETVFVVDPLLGDDLIKAIVEKVKDVITQAGGKIERAEEWGKRKLAYPIRKKTYGFYMCIEFKAGGDTVKPLTDHYHITETILRHSTLLVDSRLYDQRKREQAPVKQNAQDELFV